MNVKISYQTLQLPPPFAFAYTLDLIFQEDRLDISYELEFMNRDQISLEEIEEEGYSEDDDFNWKGSLGKVWVDNLQNDLSQIELEDESEEFNVYLHVEFDDGHQGLAVLAEDWDYRLQELIQAVYEKAGIEAKLKMQLLNIEGSQRSFFEVEGSFEELSGTVNKKAIDWDELHLLMEDIYTIDFDEAPVTKPEKDGLWIDPNGSGDYQLFDSQAGPKANNIKNRIMERLTA